MQQLLYTALKKPFFARYQKPWRWPEGIEDNGWERLRFESETGARLNGLYAPAYGPAKGNIVCAHPMGTDAKGFFLKRGHAALLREGGYNVLLFDFNGFGESESGSMAYPLDVLAAGRALAARAPGLPMGVFGLSFGAAWSLCALARPDHGFSAAALECPFTTLDEYWIRYRVPYFALRSLSLLMPGLAKELRPEVQAGRIQPIGGLFLIYGEADEVTPPSMGERLVAASSIPEVTTMWRVPGAEHTRAFSASADYGHRLLAFFDETLGRAALPVH